jgi:hypothetical protein
MQRLRPALFALAILALSATAAFAAGPGSSMFSPTSHQPKATHSAEASEIADATETADATQAPKASETPDAGATAGHPVNHGCVVSLAARTATPSGFSNHGKWVSSIAKANHGHGHETTTCALPTATPAPSATPS